MQGYLLLRESMLDSVLVARDRFLAPGGSLFPSHARLLFAPARSNLAAQRAAELQVRGHAARASRSPHALTPPAAGHWQWWPHPCTHWVLPCTQPSPTLTCTRTHTRTPPSPPPPPSPQPPAHAAPHAALYGGLV